MFTHGIRLIGRGREGSGVSLTAAETAFAHSAVNPFSAPTTVLSDSYARLPGCQGTEQLLT